MPYKIRKGRIEITCDTKEEFQNAIEILKVKAIKKRTVVIKPEEVKSLPLPYEPEESDENGFNLLDQIKEHIELAGCGRVKELSERFGVSVGVVKGLLNKHGKIFKQRENRTWVLK